MTRNTEPYILYVCTFNPSWSKLLILRISALLVSIGQITIFYSFAKVHVISLLSWINLWLKCKNLRNYVGLKIREKFFLHVKSLGLLKSKKRAKNLSFPLISAILLITVCLIQSHHFILSCLHLHLFLPFLSLHVHAKWPLSRSDGGGGLKLPLLKAVRIPDSAWRNPVALPFYMHDPDHQICTLLFLYGPDPEIPPSLTESI